ncbi:MAG: CvpA family protein [Bacteroidaceae bacterium]|nr:CvpA family protein [Bacteroidaceae bacterium]
MYLDIFIGIILIFALVRGLMNGFVKELASTIGFLVGLFVAATCYETLGEYLTVDGSEVNMFTSIVAFLLLWIIVPIIFGLLATLITKALDLTVLGIANRIGGGILSMAKYLVLLSCVLNVMVSLNILNSERTEGSVMLEPVQYITKFAMERAQEYVPEVMEKAGVK